MFSSKVPCSVRLGKPNLLTAILLKNSINNHTSRCKFSFHVGNKMKWYIQNGTILRKLHYTFLSIPRSLKYQSVNVLRVWAHQCECVFTQKLRRGQQMFCLYTRFWEERYLKELLSQMRQRMTKCSKEFVYGAIGLSVYNWDSNRISNEEINKYLNELEYIRVLANETLLCEKCKALQKQCCTIKNCRCNEKSTEKKSFDNWEPFVDEKDMIVWRRKHESGHYEYKVYGSFHDVNAEDFLNVQIDGEYRKKWDDTAVTLEVIESDPHYQSNSDVIYWELMWPKFFWNRDYVYNRRFTIDYLNKRIIIMNRGTEHPSRPANKNKHRVQDYWSCMVIKPYNEFNKPGVEFALTYFDNPGQNIPQTVTTWVTMRALPDYLFRLREATRNYKNYCKQYIRSRVYEFSKENILPTEENQEDPNVVVNNKTNEPLELLNKTKNYITSLRNMREESVRNNNNINLETKNSTHKSDSDISESEVILAPSATIQAEQNENMAYWKYLRQNYFS